MRCRPAVIVAAVGTALIALAWPLRPVRSGEPEPAVAVIAGRKLLAENNCNGDCHRVRLGNADPMTLYSRLTRRVNSREELRQQVELCVSRLNSLIFPEDLESVVTALDHDGYRFD